MARDLTVVYNSGGNEFRVPLTAIECFRVDAPSVRTEEQP